MGASEVEQDMMIAQCSSALSFLILSLSPKLFVLHALAIDLSQTSVRLDLVIQTTKTKQSNSTA